MLSLLLTLLMSSSLLLLFPTERFGSGGGGGGGGSYQSNRSNRRDAWPSITYDKESDLTNRDDKGTALTKIKNSNKSVIV